MAEQTWQEATVEALGDTDPLYLGTVDAWATKSGSDPMGFYYIIRLTGGSYVCTCKGFRFRDACRHIGDLTAG